MTITQRRRQAKKAIDALSEKRLQVASEFLRWLSDPSSEDATEELLLIQGFTESFDAGASDIRAGRTVPVENLRRKY